jgi:hypothetical protein
MQRKIATDKMKGKAKSKASTMLLISISLIIAIAGLFSILAINWRMKMHAREEAREKAISWQKLGSWSGKLGSDQGRTPPPMAWASKKSHF